MDYFKAGVSSYKQIIYVMLCFYTAPSASVVNRLF